jgi:hypothetical protein
LSNFAQKQHGVQGAGRRGERHSGESMVRLPFAHRFDEAAGCNDAQMAGPLPPPVVRTPSELR